jgi:hypothetical protein
MQLSLHPPQTRYAPLDAVIAERAHRGQALLNVHSVERVPGVVCSMGPHPGEAIGLSFQPHRQLVGFGRAEL